MDPKISATVALFVVLQGFAAEALEPAPALRNNPFHRPHLPPATTLSPAASTREAAPSLELRAILTDGDASLADINGRILSVGELFDGYRLTRVEERQAVMERDGHAVTLTLDDED